MTAMDTHYGLSWEPIKTSFGVLEELEPIWTVKPDIEVITKIVRHKLKIAVDSPCTVDFI
jgi:hypothetical protein